ncbi:MAG: MG2 domain-containing protein, partial [Planctomycetota bacterium]
PFWREFLRRFPQHERAPQARIRLATGLTALHRYDDAIAEWQAFLAAHPNDPGWQKARAAIPQAVLAKARRAAERKKYSEAVVTYNRFLQDHPDHPAGAAVLLAVAEAHRHAENTEAMLRTYRTCSQKYRGRREGGIALFQVARHLDQGGQLPQAIEQYEAVAKEYHRWPEGQQARIILETLRRKALAIRAERIFGTAEAVTLHVETRNIRKLEARLYRVDLAEYFRKKKQVAGIENLAVDVVKPDRTAAIDLADAYEPFRLFGREEGLPLEPGETGAFVVVLGEEDLTATTLTVVSDLRLVVKASRGHLFVWAFRAADHSPWPGVRVDVAAGGQVLHVTTAKDGTARIENERIGNDARVLAEVDGHYAFSEARVTGTAATGYRPVGYVFTDRPLYRPGETVKIGAFLRHVVRGRYTVPKDHEVEVSVTDANSVELGRAKVKTDDLGVIETEVPIDAGAPLGDATILVKDKDHSFRGSFKIAHFRKPEFTVALDAPARAIRPGEKVKVKASVSYLVGGPVAKAPVQWWVARQPFGFDRSRYDSFAWFFEDRRSQRRKAPPSPKVVLQGALTAGEDGTVEIEIRHEIPRILAH